jgi:hypothetical protein
MDGGARQCQEHIVATQRAQRLYGAIMCVELMRNALSNSNLRVLCVFAAFAFRLLIPSCIAGSLVGLPGKKRRAYNGIDNQ